MQFTYLHIRNFKSIRDMEIRDIENALILVGRNNTGKTSVLDAIRAVCGCYGIRAGDFNRQKQKIEIKAAVRITEEDRTNFYRCGAVSAYKQRESWERSFRSRLPSFDGEELHFTYVASWGGRVSYKDGQRKHNPYIVQVLPRLYLIDTDRQVGQLQDDILMFQEDKLLKKMRADCCMFDQTRRCGRCFQCIGLLNQKRPQELDAFETAKLLEYKLYRMNLDDFSARMNDNFCKNGGYERIRYTLRCDIDRMCQVSVDLYNKARGAAGTVDDLGKGMKSIYMLSLLETYTEEEGRISSIILVEDPEIYLHPRLQKEAGEILYRLSKKNQVIFKTHSPNMLSNFNTRQIRQVVLDRDRYSAVRETTDIDRILNDLGYTANDFLNVAFVFIVEGKQDKSRLPLLLEQYYSEVYDERGNLARIAIITTNSCTNIKTYANLKYMNQVYLRDQFLMIRDGDGQDAQELAGQLCRYYEDRSREDVDRLPKVTRRNVLILRYYSFENYFLNPQVMAMLGIVESEDAFYRTLFKKWREYLHRIRSGEKLTRLLGRDLNSPEDVKEHMELIRIHVRGHNLFDIFYGSCREREEELLRRYIELAPRDDFKDILDAIDRFIYFDSRKKDGNEISIQQQKGGETWRQN